MWSLNSLPLSRFLFQMGHLAKTPKGKKLHRSSLAKPTKDDDEEILSDEADVEDEGVVGKDDGGYESDQQPWETAEEMSHRLAKAYLEEIEREGKSRGTLKVYFPRVNCQIFITTASFRRTRAS